MLWASSQFTTCSPEPRSARSTGPCGWDRANTSTDQQTHSWHCCGTPRSTGSRPSYKSEIKDQLISHLLPLGSSVATGAVSKTPLYASTPLLFMARAYLPLHSAKWRRPSSGKAEAAAALSILFLSGNTSHAGGSCFPSCFITWRLVVLSTSCQKNGRILIFSVRRQIDELAQRKKNKTNFNANLFKCYSTGPLSQRDCDTVLFQQII